ncbi:hypothetical protein ABW365_12195 [Enterococcus avium]
METVFTLVFIIGCIGAWYFIKRSPNKRNRNISFGLITLSVIIIGFIPTTETKEVTSKPVEEKKTKQQSSAKISDLVLETPKEAISDDTGEVKISGKTSPNAEVSIGMGIVGDKTTADKSGDFMLLYELSSPETTLTINSKRDGDSKSTKIKVKMNDNALSALEEKKLKNQEKLSQKTWKSKRAKKAKKLNKKELKIVKMLKTKKIVISHNSRTKQHRNNRISLLNWHYNNLTNHTLIKEVNFILLSVNCKIGLKRMENGLLNTRQQ